MKQAHTILIIIVTLLMVSSCIKEDAYDNSNKGNFEALWKIMDEHYCFFDYKQKELGVDWNEVHSRYSAMINESMTRQQLFEVMTRMLSELKDGHVNLGASFDYGRNWSFFEDYPRNCNDSIIDATYLGHDYHIASGLQYRILDDNVGYVRCPSFSAGIGDGNVSVMLDELGPCNGLIIDVRGNGGGELTSAHTLASHFINERQTIGYVCHKTGPAHNAFSKAEPEFLEPAVKGVRWQKPVVVLTNREVFSAANDFVKCMRQAPNAIILGDCTGGGSGMPFTSELPNGWTVRYSAIVYYDSNMNHIEFGIEPDIFCSMSGADTGRNMDTLIEKARGLFKN